jgi:hypothetical protein
MNKQGEQNMARIEYAVNRDANGQTTIVTTVQQIGPGDEVTFTTITPNAALQFNAVSPFAAPAVGELYVLPHADPSLQPLQVTKICSEGEIAQCGEVDIAGKFMRWAGTGVSPSGGTNHPQKT